MNQDTLNQAEPMTQEAPAERESLPVEMLKREILGSNRLIHHQRERIGLYTGYINECEANIERAKRNIAELEKAIRLLEGADQP